MQEFRLQASQGHQGGVEEVKILGSNETPTLDFKEFNYDNCSLFECISLMQSIANSPHAYSQSKAFTAHIVDAMMKSLEGKLELEVSIPRELHDEWNLLSKSRSKTMNAMLCVIWVLVFLRFQSRYVIFLVFMRLKSVLLICILRTLLSRNPWEGSMMFLLWQIRTMYSWISLYLT